VAVSCKNGGRKQIGIISACFVIEKLFIRRGEIVWLKVENVCCKVQHTGGPGMMHPLARMVHLSIHKIFFLPAIS
jgi:hypothetical protein